MGRVLNTKLKTKLYFVGSVSTVKDCEEKKKKKRGMMKTICKEEGKYVVKETDHEATFDRGEWKFILQCQS